MGFFDKIKKAVLGEKPEEEKELLSTEETEVEELAEETDSPEAVETTTEEEAKEEIEEPQEEVVIAPEPNIEEAVVEEVVEEVVETPVIEEPVIKEVKVETPIVEKKPEPVVTPKEETIEKYDKGLEKSRRTFGQFMNDLFSNFRVVDDEFFEELEEALISADVGFETALRISDELQEEVKLKNAKKQSDVQNTIIEKLVEIYESEGVEENNELNIQKDGPTIILFVGVNGVGKTTSIGKLAYRYKQQGKKVLLAAADTFRAGAIDQLAVWGKRAEVDVVKHSAGSDPAAVVFDAVEKTKKENYDILLVDTAGRLQNKVHLMKELEKMKRVIERDYPSAPHEVLLVVDATTGQNAMTQAKEFKDTTDVTGIVLSKLDGTAKGGMVLAIRNELHLPVKLVGLGEKITDLEDFEPNQFVYGLFKDLMAMYEN
ncbi:signal recognition particle-docking protein FtsY [Vagococcus carniphilus]|uniref:signal recognition particle-docking protein FtsY n=1 Tax=Vagococcus carniphilus TaxID=218144 RepID=UPI003BAA3DA8